MSITADTTDLERLDLRSYDLIAEKLDLLRDGQVDFDARGLIPAQTNAGGQSVHVEAY